MPASSSGADHKAAAIGFVTQVVTFVNNEKLSRREIIRNEQYIYLKRI